ncbi:TyeA family type III secretion system gatekeeper subunit [Sansalvadorimonas sp. 2012CJ34-2]|uniref:TyeA family type III secretion system gatekeeper subunit n=1 Tax=Parendozoicomonas callyspongiae TaxID=2942213 RepID=A0ABT0PH29_9GAMM|nr:TyeA family type III secretion system gatekeeper subunit [Sansalvadorimonas sp. 2012CJ34-2]MCL6270561.1 TyeA family type III secretion system gatekeeper subunit [Sansalvadorimonas sp. 2012CJ34-2]
MAEAPIKQGVLVEEILRLLNQRWISATDIEGISGKMGVPGDNLEVRIFVTNQVLEMYRKIPDQYFKDDEHRENILESAQEALDDLIEQEEEEEGFENDEDDDDFEMDFDI